MLLHYLDIQIYECINEGALIQVNSSSIIGKNGKEIKNISEILLDNNMIHFIATDAHSSTRRRPIIKETYDYVVKKYGDKKAETLFIQNPSKVIENEEIEEDDKEIIEGDILPTQTESDVVYGVEKEATEDTKVGLHDVLTYTVTVKNTGNLPVYNVEVVDTIVFDENGELVVKTIEEILPGESKSVTFEYFSSSIS